MTATFAGHRWMLPQNIYSELYREVARACESGVNRFLVGTHGDFDRLALRACLEMCRLNAGIRVEVYVSSFSVARNYDVICRIYPQVSVTMCGEEEYYKRRITVANNMMVDRSDLIICYVDRNRYRSGAANMLARAEKEGLHIVNLYGK